MKVYAVIPAGGKGTRSGSSTPKQYVRFNKKELIVYTLEVFQQNKLIDGIIISADTSRFRLLNRLKQKYNLTKITGIAEGGKERQDSVYKGLCSLRCSKNDLIVVHDAARPLLPGDVLTSAILTAKKKGNALVCIKAKDTLIKGSSTVQSYMDRNEIYYVQTPQVFRYSDLMKAMDKAYAEGFTGTDESILVARTGKKIHIVNGSVLNFKITTDEDFKLLKKLL
jgi:2-C-methyl-D-erythritol 4-phosphate cytidylyltransferase